MSILCPRINHISTDFQPQDFRSGAGPASPPQARRRAPARLCVAAAASKRSAQPGVNGGSCFGRRFRQGGLLVTVPSVSSVTGRHRRVRFGFGGGVVTAMASPLFRRRSRSTRRPVPRRASPPPASGSSTRRGHAGACFPARSRQSGHLIPSAYRAGQGTPSSSDHPSGTQVPAVVPRTSSSTRGSVVRKRAWIPFASRVFHVGVEVDGAPADPR